MNLNRIKHRIVTKVFALVLAVGVFGCNTELLDPTPQTQFSDKVVFDTPARIELQVNNMYTAMKSGNFLGGRYHIYGDIRANDFINRTNNGVTGYGVWNHTLVETSTNDVNNCWNAGYAAINQINVFLQGMADNAGKFVPPDFPATFATTAQQYIAEGRFLRAVAYYSLLQLYARPYIDGNGGKPGLPLRLLAEKGQGNNDLARSTVAEVYAQIIADLNFAEANLPATYASGLLNVTRAHKNSAIAYKTRVYLTMGDYANVVTEANKIVSANAPFNASASGGVNHALQANIASVFAVPQETTESIFSLPFTAQNAPGTQNQLGFYYNASTNGQGGGGEYSLNNAGIIGNTTDWPAADARRAFNVAAAASGGAFFLRKYTSPSPYIDKAPVIRYAEVLLNLSEALARTNAGVNARALALLNAVRNRSQASFSWAPADNTALINAILTEKRIEFLGEGLRNYDLMRLNAQIPGKAGVPAVDNTAANYVWPIPSSELSVNTLCVRN
jgi:starch-binding outer membrane protein, SusD/RagB family